MTKLKDRSGNEVEVDEAPFGTDLAGRVADYLIGDYQRAVADRIDAARNPVPVETRWAAIANVHRDAWQKTGG